MTQTTQIIIFRSMQGLVGLIGLIYAEWWMLVMFWIVFAIGNGTVGHRYFAHESFRVNPTTHWILAIWCTISSYSPCIYWQVQHRHHHRHTDAADDVHAPRNGFFMSIIGWAFSPTRINSVFNDRASVINQARGIKDPAIRLTSKFFISINLCFLLVLGLLDWHLTVAACAASLFEQIRLGLVNSLCHIDAFPGNYRNHHTDDMSQNNLFLGWLGLGFGWHNNHHNDSKKLVLTERWWEIDMEGMVGKILSKL